jgi:hypothetical protein
MRTDNAAFAQKDAAAEKSPRYVIELAFDGANTILHYFTSHAGTPVPAGASVTQNVVRELSATSQTLNPDTAVATIGSISFELIDLAAQINALLGGQLALGRSTRLQRVRLFVGYEGLTFNALADREFVLVQTQLVDEIAYDGGIYKFRCLDVQRELREDIFDVAITNLQSSVSIGDTTINVFDTSAFELVDHGVSYSDAPSATVGYVKIDNEVIRYTATTATQFTGCTRGALNTVEADHVIDAGQPADRRTRVEEYVYLELPAVKLIYALLTGILHNQGGAALPANWHLGVASEFVRLTDFTGIGTDWWDPANDEAGFPVRFEGVTKRKGKEFIEKELLLLLFAYMPVYADGALGLRRMPNLSVGAAYSGQIDGTNVVTHGELKHDFKALHNIFQIEWNYEPIQKTTTRKNRLIDADSIVVHRQAEPLELKFLGLHGSRHTAVALATRFDAMRDAYAGPPLRLDATLHLGQNAIEVGDVLRAKMDWVRDFTAAGTLDRSFAVHQVSVKWDEGVSVKLFASSRTAAPLAATADATVLSDAWYLSQGSELSTVLTITGSAPGHVSANGTLAGGADMNAAASIFYYDGDLVIDAGVTVTLTGNVALRVKGFLTINGTLNARGGGYAGAVSPGAVLAFNSGTAGFLGTTVSGGRIQAITFLNNEAIGFITAPGLSVRGLNDVVPPLTLGWDGAALSGLPADGRGSSGSSGAASLVTRGANEVTAIAGGGAGGASGAGLIIVCRGASFGGAGKIDMSGVDGSTGGFVTTAGSRTYFSGSGAGGAPGACYFILDGANAVAPSLTAATAIARNGAGPRQGAILTVPSSSSKPPAGAYYSFFAGQTGDESHPVADLSNARGAFRVQFAPGDVAAVADAPLDILTPPTNLGLASGTTELLLKTDGTVEPRIRATWTASLDNRVRGYDIEFKKSADSIWTAIAPIAGINSTTAWIIGVQDGVLYDVRIRAGDGLRSVSAWVVLTSFLVVGKTAPPANVTGFQASQNGFTVTFQWNQVADVDLAGYEIRYGPLATAAWDSATTLTKVTRGTRVTSASVPPGAWLLMIKAVDTSGNASVAEAAVELTVLNALDVIEQRQEAPDWLGTKNGFVRHWTGVLVPDSTQAASDHTNEELFENFVPFPVAQAIYEADEFDIGFDDTARIWGTIDSALGPGVAAGLADPQLEIDHRLAAGAYDGYEPWTIGDRPGRFFKHRINFDTSQTRAKVIGFLPTVDLLEFTQSVQGVAIAPGGSVVTFPQPFHLLPNVVATVVGSTALFAVVSNPTTTGVTINVYNVSGASVGGTVNYDATGV